MDRRTKHLHRVKQSMPLLRTSSMSGFSIEGGAKGSTGGDFSVTNGSSTAFSSAVAVLEKKPDSDGGSEGPDSSSKPAQFVDGTNGAGSGCVSGVGSSGGGLKEHFTQEINYAICLHMSYDVLALADRFVYSRFHGGVPLRTLRVVLFRFWRR